MLPIKAPRIITIPILVNVPENPAPITLAMPCVTLPSSAVTFTSGIPAISPRIRDTVIIERNG